MNLESVLQKFPHLDPAVVQDVWRNASICSSKCDRARIVMEQLGAISAEAPQDPEVRAFVEATNATPIVAEECLSQHGWDLEQSICAYMAMSKDCHNEAGPALNDNDKLETFMFLTNAPEDIAKEWLIKNGWNLNVGVEKYMNKTVEEDKPCRTCRPKNIGKMKMAQQFAKVTGTSLEMAKQVHERHGWASLGEHKYVEPRPVLEDLNTVDRRLQKQQQHVSDDDDETTQDENDGYGDLSDDSVDDDNTKILVQSFGKLGEDTVAEVWSQSKQKMHGDLGSAMEDAVAMLSAMMEDSAALVPCDYMLCKDSGAGLLPARILRISLFLTKASMQSLRDSAPPLSAMEEAMYSLLADGDAKTLEIPICTSPSTRDDFTFPFGETVYIQVVAWGVDDANGLFWDVRSEHLQLFSGTVNMRIFLEENAKQVGAAREYEVEPYWVMCRTGVKFDDGYISYEWPPVGYLYEGDIFENNSGMFAWTDSCDMLEDDSWGEEDYEETARDDDCYAQYNGVSGMHDNEDGCVSTTSGAGAKCRSNCLTVDECVMNAEAGDGSKDTSADDTSCNNVIDSNSSNVNDRNSSNVIDLIMPWLHDSSAVPHVNTDSSSCDDIPHAENINLVSEDAKNSKVEYADAESSNVVEQENDEASLSEGGISAAGGTLPWLQEALAEIDSNAACVVPAPPPDTSKRREDEGHADMQSEDEGHADMQSEDEGHADMQSEDEGHADMQSDNPWVNIWGDQVHEKEGNDNVGNYKVMPGNKQGRNDDKKRAKKGTRHGNACQGEGGNDLLKAIELSRIEHQQMQSIASVDEDTLLMLAMEESIHDKELLERKEAELNDEAFARAIKESECSRIGDQRAKSDAECNESDSVFPPGCADALDGYGASRPDKRIKRVSSQGIEGVQLLKAMFPDCDPFVVEEILSECKGNVKDATEFLLPRDVASDQVFVVCKDESDSRRAKKKSKRTRGVQIYPIMKDEASMPAKENEWERGVSCSWLEAEREDVRKEFVPYLGVEVVNGVLQAHTTIAEARATLGLLASGDEDLSQGSTQHHATPTSISTGLREMVVVLPPKVAERLQQGQPAASARTQRSQRPKGPERSGDDIRKEAQQHAKMMKQFFSMANQASQAGDIETMQKYSKHGHLHKQMLDKCNKEAMRKLLGEKNPLQLEGLTLDLHGLLVAEAMQMLEEYIEIHKRKAQGCPDYNVEVITGKGNHSIRGIARIKPEVEKWLKNSNLKHWQIRDGLFKIKLGSSGW